MGNLFGKKKQTNVTRRKPPEVTQKDKAILELKLKRDEIQRCVQRHEYQMENQRKVAKDLLVAGKKDRALLVLKKKKFLENLISRSLDQLNTLERMIYNIEEASIQAKVVEGLRAGNEALRQLNQMFSIEEVEKIMDETKEAAEYQEEISQILSNSDMQLTDADMEEINATLEAFAEAETKDVKFPAVPTEPLPVEQMEKSKNRKVALEAV